MMIYEGQLICDRVVGLCITRFLISVEKKNPRAEYIGGRIIGVRGSVVPFQRQCGGIQREIDYQLRWLYPALSG
jgi:hypothetical protein